MKEEMKARVDLLRDITRQTISPEDTRHRGPKILVSVGPRVVADAEALQALFDEYDRWKPLTNEEAREAYDKAEAVPMTKEQVDKIVKKALGPAEKLANDEQARLVSEIERLKKEVASHLAKWTMYEQEYILPCFDLANEIGIDLRQLLISNPGKNCVVLLVRELISRIQKS